MSTVVNVAQLGSEWSKEVHAALEKDGKFIPTHFPHDIIEARNRIDKRLHILEEENAISSMRI